MIMLRSPLGAPVRPLARKVTEAGGGLALLLTEEGQPLLTEENATITPEPASAEG